MKINKLVYMVATGLTIASVSCFADWTSFFSSSKKEEPKVLSKSEKQRIITGICNCSVGSDTQYANTTADAEYEQRIRPLMNKLAESLRKDYLPGMNVSCSGGGYGMVAGARKACRATYLTYGTERELKAELEELMH